MGSATGRLRETLSSGGIGVGIGVHSADPDLLDIIGGAGFDWVSIVMEHASVTVDQVAVLQRIADLHRMTTLIHVNHPEDHRIVPLLNAGVGGVVCPDVTRPEQAQRLVQESRFPPVGHRSAHGSIRAARYGQVPYEDFVTTTDAGVWVGIGLESAEAIADADRILAIEGLSVVFVGILDLTHSLGVPGDFRHPDVRGAISSVVRIARRRGLVVGLSEYGYSLEELAAMGARIVMSPPSDFGFLRKQLDSHLLATRQTLESARRDEQSVVQ